jgi:hypothetical protein
VFAQEPHKSAYEYFFKLIAGLKHMLQTRVSHVHSLLSSLFLSLEKLT